MNKDILICGVGGQGTVLASRIIAAAAVTGFVWLYSRNMESRATGFPEAMSAMPASA